MKPFLATLCAAFALLLSPFTMAQYDPQCEEKAQYAQYSQRCDQQREQHFNALLNQGYQALKKQQTSAGKAHLRQMQRAWMRERDSECRAIVANTVVGAGMAGDKCLADYTENRALAIHTWLKQGKRF